MNYTITEKIGFINVGTILQQVGWLTSEIKLWIDSKIQKSLYIQINYCIVGFLRYLNSANALFLVFHDLIFMDDQPEKLT